jgi:methyltransferase family protein
MFGVRTRIRKWAGKASNARALPEELKTLLKLSQLQKMNLSRTTAYLYCDYYFEHFLPKLFREHRAYFVTSQRGFGEDAFHAMWFLLFEHFRPANALEIGVYRGQTITLMKLLGRHFNFQCDIGCVSPLSASGDSVSNYRNSLDYYQDVVQNHQRFDLPLPEFCRAFSTSQEGAKFIGSRPWHMIYIDGNHDYPVAKSDWDQCARSLAPDGIIVMDDSALHTDFRPPAFSTAGHPGPSQVVQEIDARRFKEIFAVGHNRVFQRTG